MTRLGKSLFRYRAVIGVTGFVLAMAFAHPSAHSLLVGLIPIAAGLILRVWAAGYIGTAGRVKEIGVQELITSGPYRFLKHPLYYGNFLLVLGVLMSLHPSKWLALLILVLFIIEYAIIARTEQEAVKSAAPSPLKGESESESISEHSSFRTPHSAPRTFSWPRARNEWITMALVGLIYLLAMLRLRFAR
jgi:isoprenylcysteine carboxyl methyltransferase (ICMT) family protein YpbQ